MKKKFDFRRVTAFLLCLLLCGAFMPRNASAAKLEEVESCTLDLYFIVGDEDHPMDGVAFRLFRVKEFTAGGEMEYTGDFKDYEITDTGNEADLIQTLSGLIARDGLNPQYAATTDEEGKISLEGLEKGLYLIQGDSKSYGGRIYTPTAVLLSLPLSDNGENWQSNVAVRIKYTSRSTGGGGDPDPTPLRYHVLKVWEDRGNEDSRPVSVTVDLLRNGEVYDSVELSAGNNWRHDWTNLSPNADWQIAEREVEGYTVSVSQSGITFVITNTFKETPPSPGPGDEDLPPEEEELEDPNTPLDNKELEDPPEEEELEDNEVPLTNLPQTGQLWWPVPFLAMGGILLILLGTVRRRRWSVDDEE